jgi:hypothetical protein
MATSAALAAAAVARARREICSVFEAAGACDPARAMPYERASRMQERQLSRPVDDGVLKQERAGGYWLDRDALAAAAARRARSMEFGIAPLGCVGVMVVAMFLVRAWLGA